MNLEKLIVFILVVLTAQSIFVDAQFVYDMYVFTRQPNTSVGDIYSNSIFLLRSVAYLSTLIAIFKLIKRRSIELIDTFKFPIFYFVIANMFWYLVLFLSKENSSLLSLYETFWFGYVLNSLNILFIILVGIYFFNSADKKEINSIIQASPKARFINWIIDLGLISIFTISYFRNFQSQLIFQNFFTERESIQLFFILNMFVYFFVLELVFLQTIGKLHNNSFVEYSGNRFTTILTRTLSRFIPFEALTCFGNKGWHDLISKTRVVVSKKVM